MTDFKYGDLICYRGYESVHHDRPLMYIGRCWHARLGRSMNDLIDILPLDASSLPMDHKDPAMWQRCYHFTKTLGDLS